MVTTQKKFLFYSFLKNGVFSFVFDFIYQLTKSFTIHLTHQFLFVFPDLMSLLSG